MKKLKSNGKTYKTYEVAFTEKTTNEKSPRGWKNTQEKCEVMHASPGESYEGGPFSNRVRVKGYNKHFQGRLKGPCLVEVEKLIEGSAQVFSVSFFRH